MVIYPIMYFVCRIKILQGVNTEAGQQNLSYLISLVDLFATCAEVGAI